MMQAFLKGNLPSTKASTSGSQKVLAKKHKEKPVPWIEKYRPKKVDEVVRKRMKKLENIILIILFV
jgi:hypothetical protein